MTKSKGVRASPDSQLEACEYSEVHGDQAAADKAGVTVDTIRDWRRKFGYAKRSRAPKRHGGGHPKREPEYFED